MNSLDKAIARQEKALLDKQGIAATYYGDSPSGWIQGTTKIIIVPNNPFEVVNQTALRTPDFKILTNLVVEVYGQNVYLEPIYFSDSTITFIDDDNRMSYLIKPVRPDETYLSGAVGSMGRLQRWFAQTLRERLRNDNGNNVEQSN